LRKSLKRCPKTALPPSRGLHEGLLHYISRSAFAIAMKQFVPLTDEMLYSKAGPPMRLVPYRCGMVCRRAADEEPQPLQHLREWHEEAIVPNALLAARLPA